ncbi:unnamed protein product [Polarella glacialis]|uniref:Uncharacterized protein n=1 Tax=Polarella glacialis TaxID=89957 RepID=A0A813KNH6_POLGL|nr:unnamed protein product [Polarella glacialis]
MSRRSQANLVDKFVEPPPGLPQGWQAVEKLYLSGKYAGGTYIRFQGGLKNTKGVCSVNKAIEKDAQDRGLDVQAELAKYEQFKKAQEDEKEKERERNGTVKGEKFEQFVEAFESEFGKLEAAVVPKIPGWTCVVKYLPTSGQTHVSYISPEYQSYGMVKSVEAVFGYRMLNGDLAAVKKLIEKARADFIKEHGSLEPGYNPLRRLSDGSTLQEAAESGNADTLQELEDFKNGGDAPTRTKRAKLGPKIPFASDYSEEIPLVLVQSSLKQTEPLPDASSVAESVATVRSLLLARRFRAGSDLLVVLGHAALHRGVEKVAGTYYEMGEHFNGRKCFQWVQASPEARSGLSCLALYVYWHAEVSRWQLGQLSDPEACLAHCAEDKPSPAELTAPWSVLKEDFFSGGGH